MINYSEKNVFSYNVKKCLSFDPFDYNMKQQLHLYGNENNIDKAIYDKLMISKVQYFTCTNECFEVFNKLPLITYHYELSCRCIKNCYDMIK
jgi:hypothetical protein